MRIRAINLATKEANQVLGLTIRSILIPASPSKTPQGFPGKMTSDNLKNRLIPTLDFPLTQASGRKNNINKDSRKRGHRSNQALKIKENLVKTSKAMYNLVEYDNAPRYRFQATHVKISRPCNNIHLTDNKISHTAMTPIINPRETSPIHNSRGKIHTDRLILMPNKPTPTIPMLSRVILTPPTPNKGTPKIPMGSNLRNRTLMPNKTTHPIHLRNKAIPTTPMLSRVILATLMPNKAILKIQTLRQGILEREEQSELLLA